MLILKYCCCLACKDFVEDVNQLLKAKRCKALNLFTTLRIDCFLLFKVDQPFCLILSISMAGGLVRFLEEGKSSWRKVLTSRNSQKRNSDLPTCTPGNDASIDLTICNK